MDIEYKIPAVVYGNLKEVFKYRNVQYNKKWLSDDDLYKKLEAYGYWGESGTRDDLNGKREFVAVIVAADSSQGQKSKDFEKMISAIISTATDKTKLEILIITKYKLTGHILKEIIKIRIVHPTVAIETFIYDDFIICKPEHQSIPKHIIMTPSEVDELLAVMHTTKSRLPKFSMNDAMNAWIGARPGNVIKIMRTSETTAVATGYRFVIK